MNNMKININKIKPVPKYMPESSEVITDEEFSVGVYGEPDSEIKAWIEHHDLKTYKAGNYTNIILHEGIDVASLFESGPTFEYMDGFSPNLNKHLHIGHFSNLVLCKAFIGLGICKQTVSIYGDTLKGEVGQKNAIRKLKEYQEQFDFAPDKEFYASKVKYDGDLLIPGSGRNEGAKVFKIGDVEFVGVRSEEKGYETTYFYQDVAMATKLNAPTLYLTGSEQNNHFSFLKQLFPHIEHIGLGLVKINNIKMSSREGNVIFIEDFITEMNDIFLSDVKLIYNVFAGFILKSNPDADKNINMKSINNPRNSAGLYISYTMARISKAGCDLKSAEKFKSLALQFAAQKAKVALKPNILFQAIVDECKEINALYLLKTHRIQGSEENKALFNTKISDVVLGCKMLGMFPVDYVGGSEEL